MADSTIRTKYKGEENMPQNPLESIPENILIYVSKNSNIPHSTSSIPAKIKVAVNALIAFSPFRKGLIFYKFTVPII